MKPRFASAALAFCFEVHVADHLWFAPSIKTTFALPLLTRMPICPELEFFLDTSSNPSYSACALCVAVSASCQSPPLPWQAGHTCTGTQVWPLALSSRLMMVLLSATSSCLDCCRCLVLFAHAQQGVPVGAHGAVQSDFVMDLASLPSNGGVDAAPQGY